MRADEAREERGVPVGLLDGGTVVNDIPKGALITARDVEVLKDNKLYELRIKQDQLLGYEACV